MDNANWFMIGPNRFDTDVRGWLGDHRVRKARSLARIANGLNDALEQFLEKHREEMEAIQRGEYSPQLEDIAREEQRLRKHAHDATHRSIEAIGEAEEARSEYRAPHEAQEA